MSNFKLKQKNKIIFYYLYKLIVASRSNKETQFWDTKIQKYSFIVRNNYLGWKLPFPIETNLGTKNKIAHQNTV